MNSSDTSAPLGSKKRDLVVLYRVAMFVLVAVGTSCVGVMLYAGESYVAAKVDSRLEPMVEKTAKELAKYLLVSTYEGDGRVMALREAATARRLDDLESIAKANRQLIDQQREQFHRLELVLREGFAKQGVEISANPR